jgi:hypothetical protein
VWEKKGKSIIYHSFVIFARISSQKPKTQWKKGKELVFIRFGIIGVTKGANS